MIKKILKVVLNGLRFFCAMSIMTGATALISLGLILLFALRKSLPLAKWGKHLLGAANWVGLWWPWQSHWVLRHLTTIEWQIEGAQDIDPSKNYLVIANHQSWIDIAVLEEALYQRTGLSRYFVKKSLLRVPCIGWICRALEFPAMHRYSKSMLAKNPALKGKDTEAARQSCLRLKGVHFKLNNFIEGTRFTHEKHVRQQSPYQYLLKPKAGGVSYALSILHDQLDGILDVTISYVGSPKTIWGVYLSRINKIVIHIKKIELSNDLIGNYEEDREFRVHFQAWLNTLWLEKDRRIAQVLRVE